MSVTCKGTARRMAGGQGHEHISHLWRVKVVDWRETVETGVSPRQERVEFIGTNRTEGVWRPVRDPKENGAWVHVHGNGRIKYVQTVADGSKTDNLLALPERRPALRNSLPQRCCRTLPTAGYTWFTRA
jgi:Protein of unknown function (DUF3892)